MARASASSIVPLETCSQYMSNSGLHVRQGGFPRAATIASLSGNPLALGLVFLNVGVDDRSVGEHAPQAVDNVAFDLLDAVARAV